MTLPNFEQILRSFCRRRPFRPFIIELVSGDRFLVGHPEALAVRGQILQFISPQRTNRLFDSQSVCQLTDELPAHSEE